MQGVNVVTLIEIRLKRVIQETVLGFYSSVTY